jgi:hypothetical protein
LNWALCLVLHDDGSRGQLVAMRYITHLECNEVTPAKLAVVGDNYRGRLTTTMLAG